MSQVEDLSSDNIEDAPQEQPVAPVEDAEDTKKVNAVYATICAGQTKGGLSISDCNALVKARKRLADLFNSESPSASEDDFIAFRVLAACVDVQQSTGVYKVEASAQLADILDELKASMDKIKNNELKAKDVKARLQNLKGGSQPPKQHQKGKQQQQKK